MSLVMFGGNGDSYPDRETDGYTDKGKLQSMKEGQIERQQRTMSRIYNQGFLLLLISLRFLVVLFLAL